MKILASTPKTLRIFKFATILAALVPLIDIVTLLVGQRTPDDPQKVLISSLFVIAGGFVVAWARKHFAVGSREHRSLPIAGFGCVALGVARMTTIIPGGVLIRMATDFVAAALFVLAFIRITRG